MNIDAEWYHSMHIARLMPLQYSKYNATLPQGRVIDISDDSSGDNRSDLIPMDSICCSPLQHIDRTPQKNVFVVVNPGRFDSLLVFSREISSYNIPFSFKNNCRTVNDTAKVIPFFPSPEIKSAWTLPRLIDLFPELFMFYEIKFPFCLYGNNSDILDLYDSSEILLNQVPLYNITQSYIDPVIMGGINLFFEKSIRDSLQDEAKIVLVKKVKEDYRYSIFFDRERLSVWNTSQDRVVTSISVIHTKESHDSLLSGVDRFKPDPDLFLRAASILFEGINNISKSNLQEFLKITSANTALQSFINSFAEIFNREKTLFFDRADKLSKEEHFFANSLWHIFNDYFDKVIFMSKEESLVLP